MPLRKIITIFALLLLAPYTKADTELCELGSASTYVAQAYTRHNPSFTTTPTGMPHPTPEAAINELLEEYNTLYQATYPEITHTLVSATRSSLFPTKYDVVLSKTGSNTSESDSTVFYLDYFCHACSSTGESTITFSNYPDTAEQPATTCDNQCKLTATNPNQNEGNVWACLSTGCSGSYFATGEVCTTAENDSAIYALNNPPSGSGDGGSNNNEGGNNATNSLDLSSTNSKLQEILDQNHSIETTLNANNTDLTSKLDEVKTDIVDANTITNEKLDGINETQNTTNTKLDSLNTGISNLSEGQNLTNNKLDSLLSIGTATNTSLSGINSSLDNNGIKIDGTNSRLDTANNTLQEIKNQLETTTPTSEQPEFTNTVDELEAKKQEFAQNMQTKKDEIIALFNISNISFSGELPDLSTHMLGETITLDPEWFNYILTFLGILVVLYAYYDALIIVLGG